MKSQEKTGLILRGKLPKKTEREPNTTKATMIDVLNIIKIKNTIPPKTRIKTKSTTTAAAIIIKAVPVSTIHLLVNTPVPETRTKIDTIVAEIKIDTIVAGIKIDIIVLTTRVNILLPRLRNISRRLLLKTRIEVTTRVHLILVRMIRNEAEMIVTISINPKSPNTKYVCMNWI